MSLAGRKILLADDEAYLTQILSFNLTKSGATVEVRQNGLELCEAAGQNIPDLIITDYQMPILDGFQACIRLKENPITAQIPVIMLTARGHRLAETELSKTNICRLFPKPFSFKQLLVEVEKVLASRSERNTLQSRPTGVVLE